MKTSTMRWMIAAATLAVAACSASAQTLKAEIPMSFRAGGKTMAAGSYEIRTLGGSGVNALHLRNSGSMDSVLVPTGLRSDAPKAWLDDGIPRISFACRGNSCALVRVYDGRDTTAYNFSAPKQLPDVEARALTVITLAMVKVH